MARRFDRVKLDDWRRRLARFGSSVLTVAEFCRRERVSLASYCYWSRRLGEALRYIRNHWRALNVFVEDGRIPIDNTRWSN
jgi:hypothetical protein